MKGHSMEGSTPPQHFRNSGIMEYRFQFYDGYKNLRHLCVYASTFYDALMLAREKAIKNGYSEPYDFVKCEGYKMVDAVEI